MTNREWLQSLTNEELARVILHWKDCDFCETKKVIYCTGCEEYITEWLNKKHPEPMPEIKAGDFIYTKTKEYECMILVCVKEEEGKILFSIDKEKCISLSAFTHKEIRKICRYDSKKHCMTEIWRCDDE